MYQLSGLDTSFLNLETPNQHMHIGSVVILDPSTAETPFTIDTLRQLIKQRIHLVPTFRRKLVKVPFNIDFPYWIDDPNFDLDFHLRHVAVPAPGGLTQLADLVSRIYGRPLDRNQPLWELYMIEGLGDIPEIGSGKIALLGKFHHAAIDGASGAEILASMIDLSPQMRPVPPPEQPFAPEPAPNELQLLFKSLSPVLRRPYRLATLVPQLVRAAREIGHEALSKQTVDVPPLPFTAPRTSFNTTISPHRRFAALNISLARAKAVKNKAGCKLNDVVLAVVSGALRRYLQGRGELPDRPLISLCPISVRSEEDRKSAGNQVSLMRVNLATDVADAKKRLEQIMASTQQGKARHKTIGAKALQDWNDFATPSVAALAARLVVRAKIADRMNPLFNLVITNVPGSPVPIYLGGARMIANYGTAPIIDGVGLMIVVTSYINRLDFGLTVCKEAVPEVWDVALALREAMDELTDTLSA
ncbi:MAG: wax ester/triacylglycerol synthase family O-acyltransferase [Proteobacteria bacterium]|nr:wax ester/triacylglycerol synthase family O-acyltransferase [Pseudomonadota bacterium]